MRGIKCFFQDFRSQSVLALYGNQYHATSKIRKKQFEEIDSEKAESLCKSFIYGKIRNQRSVLLYFSKNPAVKTNRDVLVNYASQLKYLADSCKNYSDYNISRFKNKILGYEGSAAKNYWASISLSKLLPGSFSVREKRGTNEITNSCLNYGYAILSTVIWNSVVNSGLEPYSGFLHSHRPGKPSLILDLMEEYRPWVVDRNIIKLRDKISASSNFDAKLKKNIISQIHKTLAKQYSYKNKKVKLESIIQRQVYALAGFLFGKKKFKPYIFKW